MTRARIVFVGILASLLVFSALVAVYARHETRRLFVEHEKLVSVRDALDIEWSQLRLEQSTWAAHGRVEAIATTRLNMIVPRPEAIVVVSE